ncbi:MAG: aconitase X, partial [Acidimicrobiia bacterium]
IEVPDRMLDDDLLYPVIGDVLGRVAGTEVAALIGLDARATEDRLKALGAAAASSGAVAMFHVVGVTPEAPTLEVASGGSAPGRHVVIGVDELREARAALGRGSGRLEAVSVGTPHLSPTELRYLASLVTGRSSKVPFYVNTSRDVVGRPESSEALTALEAFGATIVTDTCTYITPIIGEIEGVVMTNSGKWAFYAPGNLGVAVAFGGLRACVASAVTGEVELGEEW